MKKLPIGVQQFERIIREDFLYVDKTRQIYDLISQGHLYFLSRPRRFGKSLLVSTLKEIFQGNKELFKGLYIAEQTDYDWQSYPILQFSFAKLATNPSLFEESLKRQLRLLSQSFHVTLTASNLSDQVDELVKTVAQKGKPVVFLVDEYDKPIIDYLTDKQKANTNRKTLKDFFSPLKDLEENGHLQFLFVTGVSKFSKVSIFSDLNNLIDLTIDGKAADLVGITNEELQASFKAHIKQSSIEIGLPQAEMLKGLKLWYDGYSFDGKTFLYNPFSLLNFFRKSEFGNFWFATGTPTFLVETLRDIKVDLHKLEAQEVGPPFFDKFTLENLDIYSLLFQTGYLTIKSTRRRGWQLRYELGYPNEEVRQSFLHNLIEAFTRQPTSIVSNVLIRMEDALEEGEVSTFIEQLKILLADISYHLFPKSKKEPTPTQVAKSFAAWEGYFQTIIYLVCSFLNLNVRAEVSKHKGRIDLLAETEGFLYLMEFKLEDTAEHAIAQIKDREYAQAYKNSAKRVLLVGIGFGKEERNVESWEVEEWI